jgi:outer membrane protein insertion porin family
MNAGINFGLPLNEFDQVRFDFDTKYTTLGATSYTSNEISDFMTKNGDSFFTFAPAIGWTHDTLNRAIFPNKGGQQRLSALATVPGSDLEYYKLSYKHQMYFPVAKDFTFRIMGEAGYGDGYGKNDNLPFFENYFAGGTGSVRGFKNNTLGVRDTHTNSCQAPIAQQDGTTNPAATGTCPYQNYPLGGSTKVIGSAELFFPVPFMPDTKSVRLGTFFDAGSLSNGFNMDMKYSAGVSGEWMSPFGALSVSAAMPLNTSSIVQGIDGTKTTGDQKQIFQFNFGQNF